MYNIFSKTYTKMNFKNKIKNEILGIEEDDEKNIELITKNLDEDEN